MQLGLYYFCSEILPLNMIESFEVFSYSIDEFKNILVNSSGASPHLVEQKSHIEYFQKYFDNISTKTILVERDYVDRDFLEDFAGYYVRCFSEYQHRCTRIHLFSRPFTVDDFTALLANPSSSSLTEELLQQNYLGFIVVKPLPQTIIGRTCIATYSDDNNRRFFPIVRRYEVNLFGLSLSVKTLAFQEQDQVAAACATSALWTVFQGTGLQFQHSIPSPVEITRKAFSNFPLATRVLPSATRALPNLDGLTAEMMAQAIRDVGLEPFNISLQVPEYIHQGNLYAYLRGGLPLLLGFDLLVQNNQALEHRGKHAVAVTGYSLGKSSAKPYSQFGFLLKASRMDKIYVHDDQVGPFARMEFDGLAIQADPNTLIDSMSTSWGNVGNRALPDILLVPLYHKIRIPFQLVHDAVFLFDCSFIEPLRSQGKLPSISQRLEWDIYLTTISRLKSDIFADKDLDASLRQEILLKSMPRFIWRATAFDGDNKVLDLLFDATDIVQGQFLVCAIECNEELSAVLREASQEPSLVQKFQTSSEGKILEWFRNRPLS